VDTRAGRERPFNKGITLGALNRSEEAIVAYKEMVLRRFGRPWSPSCTSGSRSPGTVPAPAVRRPIS
jgi:hypothetical protein